MLGTEMNGEVGIRRRSGGAAGGPVLRETIAMDVEQSEDAVRAVIAAEPGIGPRLDHVALGPKSAGSIAEPDEPPVRVVPAGPCDRIERTIAIEVDDRVMLRRESTTAEVGVPDLRFEGN